MIDTEARTVMWGWACATIMIVTIVGSILYYNVNTPSTAALSIKHKEKVLEYHRIMVEKHGISPAVIECVDRNWGSVPVYQICKEILTNYKLTREEAKILVDKVKEEAR